MAVQRSKKQRNPDAGRFPELDQVKHALDGLEGVISRSAKPNGKKLGDPAVLNVQNLRIQMLARAVRATPQELEGILGEIQTLRGILEDPQGGFENAFERFTGKK